MRYITIRTHKTPFSEEQKQALAQGIERAVDAVVQDDQDTWLVFEHPAEGSAVLLDQIDDSIIEGQENTEPDSPAAEQHPQQTYVYQSDFDGQGIVTYLAGGLANYSNPAEKGLIKITSSPLANDSQPASAIVGNEVVRCVTAARAHSWFALDFGERSIAPTHYTLRHYNSWDTEALRTWTFEASVDGQNWVILRSHLDDTSLNAKGATHTWNLTSENTPTYYRYFRILQRGLNSNRHHYLALSGFEIYGRMQEPAGIPMPSSQRTVNLEIKKGIAGRFGKLFRR
jgi:hypothetical protein